MPTDAKTLARPLASDIQITGFNASGRLRQKGAQKSIDLVAVANATVVEILFIARATGNVNGVRVAFKDGLIASDSNWVQFSLLNKSAADAAIVPASAVNTNKVTGGSALVAYTLRTLTLDPAAVAVVSGQVLALRIVVTGTLPNTLTEGTADVTIDTVE